MNEWKRRLVNVSVVDITSIMRKLSPVYEMEMFATLKSAKYSDGKCNRFVLVLSDGSVLPHNLLDAFH